MYTNMHIENIFNNMLNDVSYIKLSTYSFNDNNLEVLDKQF